MTHGEFTHIDLFSGIGGFALAARWTGFKTIVFCEKDEWCQRILAKNFGAVVCNGDRCERTRSVSYQSPNETVPKRAANPCSIALSMANAASEQTFRQGQAGFQSVIAQCHPPIIPDIHDFDGTQYRGATLLTGGFPCQPFSCAGKRGGKNDDRFLWPEMVRVVAEARPTWFTGENVRGIVTMELDRVLSDLEGIGYACWPVIIPACAVDARHRRDRVWIVAHSERFGWRGRRDGNEVWDDGKIQTAGSCATDKQKDVADIQKSGLEGADAKGKICPTGRIAKRSCTMADSLKQQWNRWGDGIGWWEREPLETLRDARRNGRQEDGLPTTESLLGRVAHGIPNRVDRLKGLGNAIVPQVAAELMRMIVEVEHEFQSSP